MNTAAIISLPVGHARDVYTHYRSRKYTREYALSQAAKIEACPRDEFSCSRCGHPLDVRRHATVVRGDVICVDCIYHRKPEGV